MAQNTTTVWIDDPNQCPRDLFGGDAAFGEDDAPEWLSERCQWTLAALIEDEAQQHEESGTPFGFVVAQRLRELAVEVRDSGCRTGEEWLAQVQGTDPRSELPRLLYARSG